MDHMNWYFDTDGDNILFLKDKERIGVAWSPTDYCASVENSTREEHRTDSQRLTNETEKETSMLEGENSSGSSKYARKVDYGVKNRESSKNVVFNDRLDYQFDSRSQIDHMDGIFLSSLLEKDQPLDNLLTDMIMNSWTISEDQSGAYSSNYTDACASPPSSIWDKVEDTSEFFVPSDSDQVKGCSMIMESLEQDKQNSACAEDGEQNSLEESILHELEVVMTQLTQNTRLCFRDALYRLASSSEQRYCQFQTGEVTSDKLSLSPDGNETLRFEKMRPMETETNAIDRTIANLMFNTFN